MTETKRILIIDDEEFLRLLIKRILDFKGEYEVAETEDGKQGLDILKGGSFDLVLMDYLMPAINGNEILKIMKTDPGMQQVPVIMMTGLSDMIYFHKNDPWHWITSVSGDEGGMEQSDQWTLLTENNIQDVGISALLSKPCDKDSIIMTVERVLH